MNRTLSISLVATCLLVCVFSFGSSCYALDHLKNDEYKSDSVDPAELSKQAAVSCSRTVKSSYTTLRDFVVDYESGRKKMDIALSKITSQMTHQSWSSPVSYLNNLTRLQYRDSLVSKIAYYDSRIEQLVNHDNLEVRARAEMPELQAKAQQMSNVMTAGMFGGPLRMARAMAKMETEPTRLMERARGNVVDADNQEAAQLQALRNKLYQQVLVVDSSRQQFHDQMDELRLNAIGAYNRSVGHRIDSFANTNAALRNSANSFLRKEEHNDHAKLLDLQRRVLTNASESRRLVEDAVHREVSSPGATVVAAGGNGAVPTQYFPGPDGIGGKTIRGMTGFGPAITWPQPPAIVPLQYPNIYYMQPLQPTPLTWPSPSHSVNR